MCWHVERFRATPAERGRSTLVEHPEPVESGEALLLFVSFEKSDEPKLVDVVDRAVNEIISISGQVGVRAMVLNPYAHMFGELSSPQTAISGMDMLYTRLKDHGFTVQKLSFGMFYELELKAKGHRLARISRTVS